MDTQQKPLGTLMSKLSEGALITLKHLPAICGGGEEFQRTVKRLSIETDGSRVIYDPLCTDNYGVVHILEDGSCFVRHVSGISIFDAPCSIVSVEPSAPNF